MIDGSIRTVFRLFWRQILTPGLYWLYLRTSYSVCRINHIKDYLNDGRVCVHVSSFSFLHSSFISNCSHIQICSRSSFNDQKITRQKIWRYLTPEFNLFVKILPTVTNPVTYFCYQFNVVTNMTVALRSGYSHVGDNVELVTKMSKLSPTETVANIRHQHRFSHILKLLLLKTVTVCSTKLRCPIHIY